LRIIRIRRILDEDTGEWWYAVADVIEALTDSQKPRDYWYRMKKRVAENEGVELSTNCRQFKLKAPNNRFYDTDCADTEGMLRIIQSIPSPKAEPFKRWLAEVGTERLEELETETGRPVASSTNYLERPQVEQEQLPAAEENDDEATS
jgi:prophage antirepressor-like protein